jgi:hypothetical protein
MLEVFNRPGSEVSCDRRDETTVTPQVFALFNGEFTLDRSIALAAKLTKQFDTTERQVREAFLRTYGREATRDEIEACVAHVQKMTGHHLRHPPAPQPLPTRVTHHAVEEMTGEEVSWEEELDVLSHYQRDLKPWDVSAETRALADLCLVLFNSNEFLYVR